MSGWRRVAARLPTPVLAASIAAGMLAPVALWGAVVRETVVGDLAGREARHREVTAEIAAASIDRELRATSDALTLFASGPTLRAAMRAGDGAVLDARLGELLQGRANSLGAVLDPRGLVLAAPRARELVGLDFSHRDYFGGALSSTKPYVSEIFSSVTAGNPSVVAIAHAVRDGSDVLGVVVLTLMPSDMLGHMLPLRQVEGRELIVLDRGGRLVAATEPALQPLEIVDAPGVSGSPNEPVPFAGRQRVITAAPIASASWSLYVADDPELGLRALGDLERQLIAGGLGVGLLAVVAASGLGWLFALTLRQRTAIADRETALARTNADLESASRHKSEFLAGMSHELRTPLNAILGFSELLSEQLATVTNERQKRYLGNIRDAGTHLLGLINDVLDLSKVEAGRIELRPEHVTIAALVGPVIDSVATAASARGVVFDAEHDAADLSIDAGRARQVLYNLLSNAVKFTPTGGTVELRVRTVGRTLEIAVRDTGIGIPSDKIDRLFGTFERLHEGRFDAPGTGLGLALTKRLVDLHGGTIDVSSEEGSGTSFVIHLPDVVVDASTPSRLLVVEDERRDADLIVALASRAGLVSEVARSVFEARAAIRRSAPIGVVLDLRLPDERGERLLEALKAGPRTRGIPVVVVSVEDEGHNSRLLGADDHLTKPIDHKRLDTWLRRVALRAQREEADAARLAG